MNAVTAQHWETSRLLKMFKIYLLVPTSQHLHYVDSLEHFDTAGFVICRVFLLCLPQQRARQSLTVALCQIITVHSTNAGGQKPPASLLLLHAAGSLLWPQCLETTVPVMQDRKGTSFKVTQNLENVKNLEWQKWVFFSMIAVSFSLMLPYSFTISNGLNEIKWSWSQKWFGWLSATH